MVMKMRGYKIPTVWVKIPLLPNNRRRDVSAKRHSRDKGRHDSRTRRRGDPDPDLGAGAGTGNRCESKANKRDANANGNDDVVMNEI